MFGQKGARLFVDDMLVLCLADLPYVPATHRCPAPSKIFFTAIAGTHQIRVELNFSEVFQEASVILAYTDLHLRPSLEDIPNRARLK